MTHEQIVKALNNLDHAWANVADIHRIPEGWPRRNMTNALIDLRVMLAASPPAPAECAPSPDPGAHSATAHCEFCPGVDKPHGPFEPEPAPSPAAVEEPDPSAAPAREALDRYTGCMACSPNPHVAALQAEVAALRAEVERLSKWNDVINRLNERVKAAEAALATERARAAIWTTRDDWKKRFAPARNICNAESSVGHHCQKSPGHEGQHRDRYWNEWPAPAPQGEERCPECGGDPHDMGDGWSGCACGALWRRDRTGRAPRAEEGDK